MCIRERRVYMPIHLPRRALNLWSSFLSALSAEITHVNVPQGLAGFLHWGRVQWVDKGFDRGSEHVCNTYCRWDIFKELNLSIPVSLGSALRIQSLNIPQWWINVCYWHSLRKSHSGIIVYCWLYMRCFS